MKKKWVALVVLAIVLAVPFLFTFIPPPTDVELDQASIEQNTLIYTALRDAGIEDAVVDVTRERVLVRYDLPLNLSKDATMYYVMGAAAEIVPDSEQIIIQTYQGLRPVEEVSVNTMDVLALMNGNMTLKDFQAKVKTKSLK